jgi:hypothetical protein
MLFKKRHFQCITPLHPKIHKSKFFFDVNFIPNYIEKLILLGIDTITLHIKGVIPKKSFEFFQQTCLCNEKTAQMAYCEYTMEEITH